jgi:hypothetical protein
MSEPHSEIAVGTPAPVDGKGVGERGSSGLRPGTEGAGRLRSRGEQRSTLDHRQAHLPPGLRFWNLADALAFV